MIPDVMRSDQISAGVEVRVRGIVQGVGFRPFVWRLARECELTGQVLNDASGVLIEAWGDPKQIAAFCARLETEAPPLSLIDDIEIAPNVRPMQQNGFVIAESRPGDTRTRVAPDAAICPECRSETLSPFERRYRYPFTNCTHCGPRFSLVEGVPYDRSRTTMREFEMCGDCEREYKDPGDRRFHAQPIACHACGPRAWLERLDGHAVSFDQHSMLDDVDAATSLIHKGEIVAIKGLGGFHLACDATNAGAVERLRTRKRRYAKPFALMARDLEVVLRWCRVSETEAELLEAPEAPIVLLKAHPAHRLPEAVAPGLDTLGFMLPYTPLHVLIMRRLDRPVVMTSGNISDEPQIIDNAKARTGLAGIADYGLLHDREIANRIDDSVVRVMGESARVMRRARGYAPGAIKLPAGFENAPDLLAFGAELKSTFCIVKDGAAILSQHQGDLENAATYDDYRKNLRLYTELFDHEPKLLVADMHPEYLSTKLAHDTASAKALPLELVQHHHAHVASCMAENGLPLDSAPVLGVALDGLGYGSDGAIWGGEFLLATYTGFRRLACFKPVAMLGGAQAIREPWRNTYAHLMAELGWARFAMSYDSLELFDFLQHKPRATLERMLSANLNAPLATSCGRLFDAVAAAVGLAREKAMFEGQGALLLEAAVSQDAIREEGEEAAYPFAIPNLPGSGLPYVEPLAMWQALLGDLILDTPLPTISARFHKGIARAIVQMVCKLVRDPGGDGCIARRVALTGGCFQNKVLFELTDELLRDEGFEVLSHARVPANDGGISLGQAVIAAAQATTARGALRNVPRNSRTSC
jgi:hydrogenase maturation protein HypF